MTDYDDDNVRFTSYWGNADRDDELEAWRRFFFKRRKLYSTLSSKISGAYTKDGKLDGFSKIGLECELDRIVDEFILSVQPYEPLGVHDNLAFGSIGLNNPSAEMGLDGGEAIGKVDEGSCRISVPVKSFSDLQISSREKGLTFSGYHCHHFRHNYNGFYTRNDIPRLNYPRRSFISLDKKRPLSVKTPNATITNIATSPNVKSQKGPPTSQCSSHKNISLIRSYSTYQIDTSPRNKDKYIGLIDANSKYFCNIPDLLHNDYKRNEDPEDTDYKLALELQRQEEQQVRLAQKKNELSTLAKMLKNRSLYINKLIL